MTPTTPTIAEPEPADPPRFWWLKRLTAAVLLGVVVLVVLRWLWGWEADRRLAAAIADATARGEPVLAEDFEPANVADEDNAALLFAQAASSVVQSQPFYRMSFPSDLTEIPSSTLQAARNAVAANALALNLTRKASTRPFDSWNFAARSPLRRGFSSNKGTLGALLQWAVLVRHRSGDDAEAFLLIKDLLRMADSMDSGPDFIDHIISEYLQQQAGAALASIAYDPPPGNSPAPDELRNQLRDLIKLLLREDHYRRADVRSLFNLRQAYIDGGVNYIPSDWPDAVLSPMYKLDFARRAQRFSLVARELESPNWRTTAHFPEDEPYKGSHLYKSTRLFTNQTDPPTIGGAIRRITPSTLTRRVSAVRLAILLYRLDHHLQYPRTLDNLVPQYLASVPRDVFAPDQCPLAYRPDTHPPIVYSVGSNGKDDGGSTDWRSSDDVFALEPPPHRARPTSRQAEQHQRDQHDGGKQSPAQHE